MGVPDNSSTPKMAGKSAVRELERPLMRPRQNYDYTTADSYPVPEIEKIMVHDGNDQGSNFIPFFFVVPIMHRTPLIYIHTQLLVDAVHGYNCIIL